MKQVEKIEYRGFTITVNQYNSRAGVAFGATNNYGEPYTAGRFFREKEDAVENEKKNLDACIDQ